MTAITYDEGGLHLITGTCIAVDDQFHRAKEDDAFGYYTILSNDAVRYCITLNLPLGCVLVNRYPAVNDCVIVYAENIEEVMHPQHSFIGYAEVCHIASDAELVEELLKRQYGFTNILAPRTPKHTFQDGFCPFLRSGEFFAKATETAARNGSSSGGLCALRMCRLPEKTSIIAPKTAFRERSCGSIFRKS